MASIQRRSTGVFHVTFRFCGQRFKRSLSTKHESKARAAAERIQENIRLVMTGRMVMPEDCDVALFLMSDGQLANKPKVTTALKVGALFPAYQQQVPEDALEVTSLKTMRVHMGHFKRILGASFTLRSLKTADLQRYVTARSKERGKRGNVSAATIRKEISTFSSLWTWAKAHEYVSGRFPKAGLVFPKQTDKLPFQTWSQIEGQIQSEVLTESQAAPLWNCLYLDNTELDELLRHIEGRNSYGFLYPMALLAAHTGARRSELCRSRQSDFNLDTGVLTIRERKRSRGKRTTRTVPLSEKVRAVFTDWLKAKPSSPFTFPEDHRVQRTRKKQHEEGCVCPDEAIHHLERSLVKSKWKCVSGWHVFRHTFISACATNGIDQRFIDAWVGHQTEEQRRRYRHLFPDTQKAAIDLVFCG